MNFPKKKYLIKANLKNINTTKKIVNNFFFDKKIIFFFLLDGPPFANGELHIGHILNKTIKNILIKVFFFKNLLLLSNLGWDCHGLPIEQSNTINNLFFLNCRKFVCKIIKIQKTNISNFNYFNYFYCYNTMEPKYESLQYKIYNFLIIKKIIFKEKIPILWCFKCCSSLSYSEILYKKINAFSFYIKIKFLKYFIIVWTTTLWSIINNQSIFFLKNQIYIIYKSKKELLIFSNFLLYKIIKILKLKGKIFAFLKGKYFFNKKYFFFLRKIIYYFNKSIIFHNNSYLDLSLGSGFIHCSPSNGVEDFELYYKKNKIYNFYNKKCFIKKNIFRNINIFFYSKILFKFIKKRKILLKKYQVNHNSMFCWRHKKPIIYYLSNQIFINLNFNYKKYKIKTIIINKLKNIKFYPSFIKNFLKNMIFFRSNWCISRQRYWGVPILYNNINKISYYKNISKSFGSQIIFYIDKKKTDIFDVWFDSAVSSFFVDNNKIIVEGKDQIRGWYQSCVIINFFIYFKLNIEIIVSHNFCIDNYGNKLSKSSKNFKTLDNILKINSDEIIKLYLLEHDFTKNIIFNEKSLLSANYTYITLRNFLKFLINNFYKFNFKNVKILIFDLWVIDKTNKFSKIIEKLFFSFNYYNAIKTIKLFITFMNNIFFSRIKNVLYLGKSYSIIRNSSLFIILYLLSQFKKILFPLFFYTYNELEKFFFTSNKKIIKKKNISLFFKFNQLTKNNVILYKNNIFIKKLKKDILCAFKKEILINNFFWNWTKTRFAINFRKKNFFCKISKEFIIKKNYCLTKSVCKSCLINLFSNYEEVKFYV
ncbi:class I tRNA ligase family protein [Candidatus Carsonella ruddii]|uniref:isoleucine--tRNA ligase n=1 Tax=Candidatus Carsonella ruddii (Diaphorina cf. continua) TaxID=2661587 RepID=A0A7R7ABJ4_CARRU|nr:class I tRNA ligase family protein [Candidatus Carsonella ruddii (Diaphorina cf. continua)]BCG49368.1 isoleucine--tRNA ligase [Candidatus Carsonella ruddii (Diaphorina cf. continua)]